MPYERADFTTLERRSRFARRVARRYQLDPDESCQAAEEQYVTAVRQYEAEASARQAAAAAEAGPPDADARPVILITTEEHQVNAQAARALARDPGVYQRGGALVRVVRDSSRAEGIRRHHAPRIDVLPNAVLRERLAENACWKVQEGDKVKEAHPPAWCVAAVAAAAHWPGIRHLEAVVGYPVLRPDGTLLARPGYDEATGLLLEPAEDLPEVPEHPTPDDAQAALQLLLEVVADFPFAQKCHRAAWLAGLLTPLARFAFAGPSPLFLADANVAGAGKGLLVGCIERITTGRRATVATFTLDEDEMRKRITALAMAGDPLVVLDNIEGRFANATVNAAL